MEAKIFYFQQILRQNVRETVFVLTQESTSS